VTGTGIKIVPVNKYVPELNKTTRPCGTDRKTFWISAVELDVVNTANGLLHMVAMESEKAATRPATRADADFICRFQKMKGRYIEK
jgi:hypothetical protein